KCHRRLEPLHLSMERADGSDVSRSPGADRVPNHDSVFREYSSVPRYFLTRGCGRCAAMEPGDSDCDQPKLSNITRHPRLVYAERWNYCHCGRPFGQQTLSTAALELVDLQRAKCHENDPE